MRYLVFTESGFHKKDDIDKSVSTRESKMKAEWVDSFIDVEKKMKLPEYVTYVPETRWCKG